jgi:hypothetical protein
MIRVWSPSPRRSSRSSMPWRRRGGTTATSSSPSPTLGSNAGPFDGCNERAGFRSSESGEGCTPAVARSSPWSVRARVPRQSEQGLQTPPRQRVSNTGAYSRFQPRGGEPVSGGPKFDPLLCNRCVRRLPASVTSHERLVLMLLISYANSEGRCFPSRPTLAEAGATSVSQVGRSLRRLCARGLVVIVRRCRTSNVYEVRQVTLTSLGEAATAQKERADPAGGSPRAVQTGHGDTLSPQGTTQKNMRERPAQERSWILEERTRERQAWKVGRGLPAQPQGSAPSGEAMAVVARVAKAMAPPPPTEAPPDEIERRRQAQREAAAEWMRQNPPGGPR